MMFKESKRNKFHFTVTFRVFEFAVGNKAVVYPFGGGSLFVGFNVLEMAHQDK